MRCATSNPASCRRRTKSSRASCRSRSSTSPTRRSLIPIFRRRLRRHCVPAAIAPGAAGQPADRRRLWPLGAAAVVSVIAAGGGRLAGLRQDAGCTRRWRRAVRRGRRRAGKDPAATGRRHRSPEPGHPRLQRTERLQTGAGERSAAAAAGSAGHAAVAAPSAEPQTATEAAAVPSVPAPALDVAPAAGTDAQPGETSAAASARPLPR